MWIKIEKEEAKDRLIACLIILKKNDKKKNQLFTTHGDKQGFDITIRFIRISIRIDLIP